jgi:hypothetical protein
MIFLKILYVARVFQTSQVSTSSYLPDVWPTNLIDQSFKERSAYCKLGMVKYEKPS